MSEPTAHERGCQRSEVRESQLLAGYLFCPTCKRMIKEAPSEE